MPEGNDDHVPRIVAPEIETTDAVETAKTGNELTDVVLNSSTSIDLFKELKGRYQEDHMFNSIIDKPKVFRNFDVEDGLIYMKEAGRRLLCIPKILVNNHIIQEIIIAEAHSMLAHLGASKTLSYLRDHVWWKDIVSDTKAFCDTCNTCKRSKPSNQKPYGLLNLLELVGLSVPLLGGL